MIEMNYTIKGAIQNIGYKVFSLQFDGKCNPIQCAIIDYNILILLVCLGILIGISPKISELRIRWMKKKGWLK